MTDVTRILNAIERGDAKATDELLPLVYEELRLLAAQKLSHEAPGQTLQATALVHEAYLRLVGDEPRTWNSRGHFFAAAAEAMRRILVERARHKRCLKQGDGLKKVDLEGLEATAEGPSENVIVVDEALGRLAEEDPLAAELVKMRYFAGLTLPQTAEALGMSARTADRCWSYAKAWLYQEIAKGGPGRTGETAGLERP